MTWRRALAKLGALFRRRKPVDDVEEEIRSHLAMEEQENLESGMPPDEAHYAALRRFGNVALAQERSREMWGWNSVETLLQDLRYGLRMLWKNPGFTAVAVLTLALGIGANTAIFTVVNSVVLRPLALPHPERVVELWEAVERSDWSGSISYPNLRDWQDQNTVFEGISAILGADFNFEGKDGPVHVHGNLVSPNFFPVMGVKPRLGRTFSSNESEPGHSRVAVLSEALWRSQFGGDPDIIGRTVSVNDRVFTIIGVMPSSFRFPWSSVQIWVPLVPDPSWESDRDDRMVEAFGRLKAGVTLAEARGQMTMIARRLAQEYPKTNKDRTVRMIPLLEVKVGDVRQPLWILQCAVAFIFLIALANVTNLTLSRAARRQKEFAVRAALGAGRWRLTRQLLGESLLLTFAGAALGSVLAAWGVRFLVAVDPQGIPRLDEIHPDVRVLVLTAAFSLVGALALAAATALKASGWNLQETLKEGGRGTAGGGHRSLNRVLVSAETAVALVLLIGAGLLLKSLWLLFEVNPGVDVHHVLTMRLAPSEAKYSGQHPAWTFYEPLLEKVGAIPGIRAAGLVTFLPIQRAWCNGDILVEGQSPSTGGKGPWAEYRAVSMDYYRAIHIPLVRGRYFTAGDNEGTSLAVIVNQTFAKDYLSGQDPLGKQVQLGGPPWATIVGVVRDVRQAGLDRPPLPEVDFPYRQAVLVPAWPANFFTQSMSLVLGLSGEPMGIVAAVRAAVRSVDPAQPVFQVETMQQVIADSTSSQRFYAWLLGAFAVLALALAALGTYGVLAYQVGERTHEIGTRMALGASQRDVLRLVVGQGLKLTLVGVAIGVAGAMALTRFLSSLLWNVRPTDAFAFMVASLILTGVAVLASYIPARRATRVDPMVALRYE
jgi:putative ABC transport system permease protein